MNKVLITGGNGFLGKFISREFLAQGWQVYSIDKFGGETLAGVESLNMEIPSPGLAAFFDKTQPNLIIHAAGTASVADSMLNPLDDFDKNARPTTEILDAQRKYCPTSKIIYISSAAVYGNPSHLPIKESDPRLPISPYGYHKLIGELLIEEYQRIYNLAGCCVRLFSAYGPGLRRQILWDVCQKATHLSEVRLMGSGEESRDMIHARDVAKSLILLADKASFQGEVYNLASGNQVRVKTIAKGLLAILNPTAPLIFSGERRAGDPLYWQADISTITKFGFQVTMDIQSGLREYAEWFKQNAS